MDRRTRRDIERDLTRARSALSDTIAELRHRLMSGDAASEATAYATAALRRPSPTVTAVALAGAGIAVWLALRPGKPEPVATFRDKTEAAMHSLRGAVTAGLDEAGRTALSRALDGIDHALGDRFSLRRAERSGPSTQTMVIGSIAAAVIGLAVAGFARRGGSTADDIADAADDMADTAAKTATDAAKPRRPQGKKTVATEAEAASSRVTAAAPAKRPSRARQRKAPPAATTTATAAPRVEPTESQATA
ncbi:MAG: hypothetical protein ACK4GO_02175 [Gemmobacter sp.]